jgi:hypothetical protein
MSTWAQRPPPANADAGSAKVFVHVFSGQYKTTSNNAHSHIQTHTPTAAKPPRISHQVLLLAVLRTRHDTRAARPMVGLGKRRKTREKKKCSATTARAVRSPPVVEAWNSELSWELGCAGGTTVNTYSPSFPPMPRVGDWKACFSDKIAIDGREYVYTTADQRPTPYQSVCIQCLAWRTEAWAIVTKEHPYPLVPLSYFPSNIYTSVGKQCRSGTGKEHGTRWIVLIGAWGTRLPTSMLELLL